MPITSTESTATCPECDGRPRTHNGETICDECGLVLDEYYIDHGPEWRSFNDDTTNSKRTGAPLTRSRHDRGLSTEIGRSTRMNGRKRATSAPTQPRSYLHQTRTESGLCIQRNSTSHRCAVGSRSDT